MSQNYNTVASSDFVRDSRQVFLDRDDALRSNFSGTSYPSGNAVVVGMTCYRTDLGQKYECISVTGTGAAAVGQWLGSFSADPVNNPAMTAAQVGLSGVSISGEYLRRENAFGYFQIGTGNASYAHMFTDAPSFYTNVKMAISGEMRIFGSTTYFNATQGFINGGEVWHSGNDGPGSGLDADTLDGLQANDFLRSNANASIGTAYSLSFGAVTRQMLNLYGAQYAIGVQGGTVYVRTGGEFAVHLNGVHNNAAVNPGTGGTNTFRVTSAGHIYTPAYGWLYQKYLNTTWAVTGNSTLVGTMTATNFNSTSDRDKKKAIKDVKATDVAKLSKVRPVEFVFKGDKDSTKNFGVIAQEVEKIYPNLVRIDKDEKDEDVKSVNYLGLISLLIAKTQEQDEAIAELKAMIK